MRPTWNAAVGRGPRGARSKSPTGLLAAALIAAVLVSLVLPAAVSAVKTPSGIGCDVAPGTTTVGWHPSEHFSRIELSWGMEDPATGDFIPVGSTVVIDPKAAKPPFTAPTPVGADLWRAEYFDKKGNNVAVAGGVCN